MTIVSVAATALAALMAYWLGLFLLAREPRKALLWSSGSGLVLYAVSLASGAFVLLDSELDATWGVVQRTTLLLPLVLWLGTLLFMLPDGHSWRVRFDEAARWGLPPLALAVALLGPPLYEGGRGWFVLGFMFPFGAAGVAINAALWRAWQEEPDAFPRWLVPAATLFFGLGVGLTVLPLLPLPMLWLHLALAADLVLLGIAVAALNAFEEGETARLDMVRTLGGSVLLVVVLGGQVVLVMVVGTGLTPLLLGLLLAVCASAVALQLFDGKLARLLDRLLLPIPGVPATRAALRETVAQLPRRPEGAVAAQDEGAFERQTRRTLSHLSNLPRLAASPLAQLPQVNARLAEQSEHGPLARAAVLQALLTERIDQLRPADGEPFGTTEAWRHYNALYFPYVVGLKPYRRRPAPDPRELTPAGRAALEWFQRQVPERTLYNWQNAAARLIARDLRAEARRIGGGDSDL